MELLTLFCVIAFAFTGLTSGAGLLPEDSVIAAVGGSVTFTTSLTPTGTPLHFISWNKGTANILTSVAGDIVSINPEYKDRVTLNALTGSLELRNLAVSDAGEYGVTIRTIAGDESTGQATLNIYDKIGNANVKSSNPPVEGGSVNLTCDASGSIFTREWMINGVELKPSENIVFYEEKRVLSFKTLTRKDNGRYTCNISNPVSSDSAFYEMNVNYGPAPDSVQISGPTDVQEGSTLKLSCSAESVPTAKYTWTKDGTALGQSHEYTKDNIKLSDSGEYICRATNDVTLKSLEASHTLNVTVSLEQHNDNGCSTGCIVGIVFGCIAVILLVSGGVFYALKKKKQKAKSDPRTDGEGRDNSTFAQNQEVNYADVQFVRKDGAVVQLGSQNGSQDNTEYSQVRKNNNPPVSRLPSYNAHMQQGRRAAPEPPTEYAQVRPR